MPASMLFAAALTGQALVDEADRLNWVYTQCLFATVRDARSERVPLSGLDAVLEERCRAEREQFQPVFLQVRQQRGDTLQQAWENWARVHANSIDSIRRAYVLRLAEDAAG